MLVNFAFHFDCKVGNFFGSFLLYMCCDCHAFASFHCSLVVTCWVRAGLLALLCDELLCFCHFPVWYLGSSVVLDLIDSWSLPPFILSLSESLTAQTKILLYRLDGWNMALCCGCCQAHQGLTVGFLLLRYSVLFTVSLLFALSPFHILTYML